MANPDVGSNGDDPPTNLVEDALKDLHPLIARMAREGPYYDPQRVAVHAAPFGDKVVEALLSDPELVGCYIPKEDARRELVDLARWLAEMHPYAPQLRLLGTRYCVVRHYGNKVRVFFKADGQWRHMSPAELKLAYANMPLATGFSRRGPPILKNAAEAWLEHPSNDYYDRAEFLPGELAPPDVLNLWIEPTLKSCPVTELPENDDIWRHIWSKFPNTLRVRAPHFMEHVYANMCGSNDEIFEFLVGWMTDALWNMQRTSEVAIVMRGPQGSGKGFWAEHFMELFAPHTLILNSPRQLVGNFNSHLQSISMVFADEAFFAGHRQHANTLKTLITSDRIFIEPKGVDGFMADKKWRVIIASNDEHVIRAEIDDRRFFMLEVDSGKHNNDGDYFGQLAEAWEKNERDQLFFWLTSPDAKIWLQHCWDVHDRPKTSALAIQKDLSLPEAQMVIHNMLRDGEPPCDFLPDLDGGRVFIPTQLLAKTARLATRDVRALGDALHRAAGDTTKSSREYLGEDHNRKQYRGFWLPRLDLARANWEKFLKRKVDWPGDVQTWALEQLEPDEIPF